MKFKKKFKMYAAIVAMVFVVYNIVLFAGAEFTGHNSVFWTSWIFMIIAFSALAAVSIYISKKGLILRDWIFNYTVMKHSVIFLIVEFIVSTAFIIFEKSISWKLAFPVQLVILAVYFVFAISCFISRNTIENVQANVKEKTSFIKMLRVDTEMLSEKCPEGELKEQCRVLADNVRMSDPMSNEKLGDIEKLLSNTVSQCNDAIINGDYYKASELCKKAELLLTERNKKTKMLK